MSQHVAARIPDTEPYRENLLEDQEFWLKINPAQQGA